MEPANEIQAQFAAAVPLKQLGRSDEITVATLFLASDGICDAVTPAQPSQPTTAAHQSKITNVKGAS